jgi:hypothetical protein
MTVATVALSRLLRVAGDYTGTVLTAAVIHGGINAAGGALILMTVGGSLLVNSPVGLTGALAALLVSVGLSRIVDRHSSPVEATPC